MNDTRIEDPQVEVYVHDVAAALGHLDEEERAAVLDDVREHATAVLAAEPEVDLTARLGSARDFALELLESAGLTAAPASSRRETWRTRYRQLAQGRAGRLLRRVRQDFGPAWAALRGVAVVVLGGWLLSGGWPQYLPLLIAVGAIGGWLLSARYQALVSRSSVWRAGAWIMNAATVVVGLMLLTYHPPATYDVSVAEPVPSEVDGWYLGGIQAFGPDGRSVPVALFDGNGNPFGFNSVGAGELLCPDNLYSVAVPYLSSTGQPMDNVFPDRGVCVDDDNIVVTDARLMTTDIPIQTWTLSGMPAHGQRVIVDDEGSFQGVVATGDASPTSSAPSSGTEPAPTPTPTGG